MLVIVGARSDNPRLRHFVSFLILQNDPIVPMPRQHLPWRVVVVENDPFHLVRMFLEPAPLFKVDVSGVPIRNVVQHQLSMVIYLDIAHNDVVDDGCWLGPDIVVI
jgi:hypothetical protein